MIPRLFALSLILGCFISLTNAQVVEEQRHMSMGQQNALILDFQDVDERTLFKEWRSFTQSYGKIKKVKKSNEFILANIQVVDIGGASRIDIYSETEKAGGESSKVIIWIDRGDGILSSDSDPEGYAGAVKFLQDFGHHMNVYQVETELEVQKKELDKLSRNLERLQKNNERYHNTIEKAKETIAKNEDNLAQNAQDQVLTQKEIEAQHILLKEIEGRLEEVRAARLGRRN